MTGPRFVLGRTSLYHDFGAHLWNHKSTWTRLVEPTRVERYLPTARLLGSNSAGNPGNLGHADDHVGFGQYFGRSQGHGCLIQTFSGSYTTTSSISRATTALALAGTNGKPVVLHASWDPVDGSKRNLTRPFWVEAGLKPAHLMRLPRCD